MDDEPEGRREWPAWPQEPPSGWPDDRPEERRRWADRRWDEKLFVILTGCLALFGLVVLGLIVFLAFALREWGSMK